MGQPVQTVTMAGVRFDQAVVDAGDLESVQRILTSLGISHREFDRIDAFDLVLLGIAEPEDVDALEGGPEARHEIETYNAQHGVDAEVTAFDVLTRLLRNLFQRETGRDLSIGKNRDVDQLEALPHWGGGEGLPTAATAREFRLPGAVGEREPRGEKMTIGVLDSALYPSLGLEGRVKGLDVVTDRPPRRAWEGHAAFVAGRILLRAPNADVVVRSVLDKNGMAKAWDVAYQMAELVELGATVLTMALASYPQDGEEPFLIGRAVERVNQKALIVAAAGNHGNGNAAALTEGRDGLPVVRILATSGTAKAYPAASADVVAVGAALVEEVGGRYVLTPADFTPRVDWVTVWAPGVNQVSTFLEGNVEARTVAVADDKITVTAENLGLFDGYASWSGTSPATGDVSGEIARLAESGDLDGARKALKEILGRPAVGEPDATDIRPAREPDDDWPQVT